MCCSVLVTEQRMAGKRSSHSNKAHSTFRKSLQGSARFQFDSAVLNQLWPTSVLSAAVRSEYIALRVKVTFAHLRAVPTLCSTRSGNPIDRQIDTSFCVTGFRLRSLCFLRALRVKNLSFGTENRFFNCPIVANQPFAAGPFGTLSQTSSLVVGCHEHLRTPGDAYEHQSPQRPAYRIRGGGKQRGGG